MANEPSIDTLLDRINTYFGKVNVKLTEKVPVVAHAINTLKISGSTLAQMVATAVGYSSVHIANKSNPHKVTPEQAGSYGTADFNALIAQQINSGIVPISRYGTLSYLPPGVSGSFSGASTVKGTAAGGVNNYEQYSMQLEDNGTLAFLRNGTDGSTIGVYYGYIENAANNFTSASKPVMTTKLYEPLFTPVGQSVAYLMQGGQAALAGRFQNAAGAVQGCFIALTNGTLDHTAHVACLLPAEWSVKLERSEIVRGKDKVFIIYNHFAEPSDAAGAQPLDLELYSFPISDMDGFKTVIPTKEVIGECTGFLGAKYNTGDIRMAARAESNSRDIPALIQHIGGYIMPDGWWSGSRSTWANGRVLSLSAFNADFSKLRIMTYQDPRYNKVVGGLASTKIAWSCVIDMATMKVTLDEGLTPMVIEQNPNVEASLVASGTIQSPNNGQWLANFVGIDQSTRSYLTETGLIFSSRIPYAPTGQDVIHRGKWDSYSSVFDMIKAPLYDHMPTTRTGVACPLTFGSVAGDGFDGFRWIPGNCGVVMCRNKQSVTSLIKFKMLPTGDPLTTNYRYSSTTYPEGLDGFKPRVDREVLNYATYRPRVTDVIMEMDDNGLKGTYGTVLCNFDGLNSRYISLNEDLSTTGVISATIPQLETLRDAILAAGGTSPAELMQNALIELVIPQNPNIPAFASVMFSVVGKERWMIVARVNVSARSGVIASMSLDSVIGQYSGSVTGTINPMVGIHNDTIRQGTFTIYEMAGEYAVLGCPTAMFSASSGSVYMNFRFLVNKSDGAIVNYTHATASTGIVGARWGGFPGKGVGAFQTNDYTSKLIYKQMAKTKAEFIGGRYLADNLSTVLLSQQVAQGWIVYFTEDTPVIMNGVPGVLPSMTIDLTTVKANPANTLFYVYVTMTAGVTGYVIYDQYMTETADRMFVGTVQTGDSSIVNISVNKITKFAGFRLSTTPAGNSVPVTSGLPSRESHLDAGWLP